MKTFDPDAVCPKCGGTEFHTSWCEAQSMWNYDHGARHRFDIADYTREHIHRHCSRCHYEWLEAPLDARPAAPEEPEGGET